MANLVDVRLLTPAERLQLIERLWDSLSPAQDLEMTDAQRAELERRDGQYDQGKMMNYSEEEVFEALEQRARS